jgi:hypothetical protein
VPGVVSERCTRLPDGNARSLAALSALGFALKGTRPDVVTDVRPWPHGHHNDLANASSAHLGGC